MAALFVWCERDSHLDRHAVISGLDDASFWLRRKYNEARRPVPPPMPVFPAPPVIPAPVMARWSNAVLVAVLPQISDCAKRLDLPIPSPITTGQVSQFEYPTPGWSHEFIGVLVLTNGYFFNYSGGMVYNFAALDAPSKAPAKFAGNGNMTTNEAIDLARNSFAKLGYKLTDFHMDEPPNVFDGPYYDTLPFCRIDWQSPASETNTLKFYSLEFRIDMKQKRIVGMSLAGMRLMRPVPRIDFTPEQESDFTPTNAPPSRAR